MNHTHQLPMVSHHPRHPSHANLMRPPGARFHLQQQQLLLPGHGADAAQRRAAPGLQRGHQAAIRAGAADGLLHLDVGARRKPRSGENHRKTIGKWWFNGNLCGFTLW